MKPIYVAFMKKDGTQGWLLNPRPFFDGRLCLSFSTVCPTAGVTTELFKPKMGAKDFLRVVQDELDRVNIPWSSAKRGRFGTKIFQGKAKDLYLMDIILTGPLPLEVAEKTEGKVVKKPVKIMSRFGG
jgi:hypothetical protein